MRREIKDIFETSIIRKKKIKVFHPLKEEEELVLHIQTLNRLRNLMVRLRMCSTKINIVKSYFSVGWPLSRYNVVSKEDATKFLKGLNPSKASMPDELHPRVLKELATDFAHLFQQSPDTGAIPSEWSLANICPL